MLLRGDSTKARRRSHHVILGCVTAQMNGLLLAVNDSVSVDTTRIHKTIHGV